MGGEAGTPPRCDPGASAQPAAESSGVPPANEAYALLQNGFGGCQAAGWTCLSPRVKADDSFSKEK